MRILALLLALAATPAAAWDFTSNPVCTLRHETAEVFVRVTHDGRRDDPYAIAITRKGGPWLPGPVFSIRFEGPARLTISTPRHRLSADGATLTVSDRGFGNVLNGLARNSTAIAFTESQAVMVPLSGAADAVAAFRACAEGLTA